MNQTHTPGPWILHQWSDLLRVGNNESGIKAVSIVEYYDQEARDPEMIANAHLITAAPEMLELLKRAQELLARSKRIIESQSTVPHLIEENLESMRLKIDDLLERHQLSEYTFIAAKPSNSPTASDDESYPLPELGDADPAFAISDDGAEFLAAIGELEEGDKQRPTYLGWGLGRTAERDYFGASKGDWAIGCKGARDLITAIYTLETNGVIDQQEEVEAVGPHKTDEEPGGYAVTEPSDTPMASNSYFDPPEEE